MGRLRTSLLAVAIFLAGVLCLPATAQLPLTGAGTKPVAVGYTGPGDIYSTAYAWWGFRAYSSATRGNRVANICNVADVVCSDISSDATTGVVTVPLIGGSNCAVVACTVKTLYDQTGALNCGGAACDLTGATRPALTLSCLGSLPCATLTRGTSALASASNTGTTSQPYTISMIASRTANFTSTSVVLSSAGGGLQDGFTTSANTLIMFAGSVLTKGSVADSTTHAIQWLHNGGSSQISADGSTTSGNGGTATPSSGFCLGNCGSGYTGIFAEAGLWVGDKSASFSSMNSNQHTFWGF